MSEWYRNEPSGSTPGKDIPAHIRQLKQYITELLSAEHQFEYEGNPVCLHLPGKVTVCQFVEQLNELNIENGGIGFVYQYKELYSKYKESLIKIGGWVEDFPVGTKTLFKQDTPPPRWGLDLTLSNANYVIYVTSVANKGGTVRSGTWNITGFYVSPNPHSHVISVSHKHQISLIVSNDVLFFGNTYVFGDSGQQYWFPWNIHNEGGSSIGSYILSSNPINLTTSETSANSITVTHSGAWSPARTYGIICRKTREIDYELILGPF